jgi:hypothetical protein
MISPLVNALIIIGALAIGGAIGYWFGSTQNSAASRNKKKYENGNLKSGWVLMPGSMSRVAMLLVLLVVIQVAIPVFFHGNIEWILSAGIVLGYGWSFIKHMRERSI